MSLKEKDKAPDFELLDQDGKPVRLSGLKGQWVLIYFYPKDDTPGCTKEACTIQERLPKFDAGKLTVLGISPDDVQSHRKFADKFKLTFQLLADTEKTVVNAYGVWALKKFMGNEYMGVVRNSFLVAPDGKIAKVYPKVTPEEHADEVLADLKALKG